MYAITLETARQDKFNLENRAYSPFQPNKIYSGDKNELVLKLTNHANEPLQLFGGELPASAKGEPNLKSGPTTLFLDFGNVFTQEELSRMSIDKISVGGEAKPFKDAGWKFKSFAEENRLGLCPGSEVVLPAGQSVAFYFAGVSCTNQVFAQYSLHIYYANLGARLQKNLGSFKITPLMVSDPPETRIAIGNNLTVNLTSDDDSKPTKAWITSQAYLDANPNSWLPNELKLNLAYTPENGEGTLDLTGAEFLLSFVAGDETDNGALTTPEQVNQIDCIKDENWSVDPEDAKPWRHWKFTTQQPLKANSTATFKFNNIHIGPKFLAGEAYAYLLFRNLPGFLDSWFPLTVVRSQATPVINPLTGPATEVPYGTEVKLSWSSFAVPCLGLAYSTDYPTGISQPVNKLVPGTATNEAQGKIGEKTTFILSGYNSKADFSSNKPKPIPGLQKELIVPVTHTSPTINSFTATCSPKEALLQWNVTFGEMESWLNVEIQDKNGVKIYEPEPKDRKSGTHTLKSNGIFDEKTTFKLRAWSSKLTDMEKPTKGVKVGNGLNLIKYFTATPESPFVLGPAKTTLQWEVLFDDLGEVTIEQDGKPVPAGANKKTGPLTIENVTAGTTLKIYAKSKRNDAPKASLDADVKTETVEDFLVRKGKAGYFVAMYVDTSGQYFCSLLEELSFYKDHAEYSIFVGASEGKGARGPAEVKYESRGELKQDDDGSYYVYFNSEPVRYVGSQIYYPVSEFWGKEAANGEYWIPSLPEFKFRIKPTGIEGGRLWHANDIMQFNAHQAGWWTGWKYCRPTGLPPPSFLAF